LATTPATDAAAAEAAEPDAPGSQTSKVAYQRGKVALVVEVVEGAGSRQHPETPIR
jgi:hypothetical protein